MKGIKNSLKERIALLRIRQGDAEAFGFIYDSYIDRIHRYVAFRISDAGLVHDLIQDVFLETWEYLVSKRPVDNIRSFLYRVAHNKIVDYYRTRERQAALITDLPDEQPIQNQLEATVDLVLIKKSIVHLKSEYQDVIVLRFIEGLNIAEISAVMSKEPPAIRVLLHRALASLRQVVGGKEEK
ncbi:MAG: hypothetical protein A3B30_04295 [Candidatus Komeilibacteria bacterium RIFCSPLOWO2_01_FULL_52_15]|uniref:RNA polymerase sigma factor n=2 Tax=Candidatus Komeiliibacteriota TaxID=1817908 RepID=A0A1G2BPS1_9BACT|nr:MAG: hypothetical protein A2677_04055 [Candidatus Komeilibacteria bacterium RIFCSPHIGHO2_01_FULL_52_14]OGY91103.1 MAG: hypothetical protein A3B30_04295 [Candidatus Komeilibacteria bacterium RIFCSPLOWO2_01_FULL_52_15]